MNLKSLDRRQFLGAMSTATFVSTMSAVNAISKTNKSTIRCNVTDIDKVDNHPKIKQLRDVALNILKPSKKEYEHGMELHRNALVIEGYGFSPYSAINGDEIRKLIDDGGTSTELGIKIENQQRTRLITDTRELEEFINAWNASGITCVFQNAGEESNDIPTILQRLSNFTFLTDMIPDFLRKAVTPGDIEAAKANNSHCLYFSSNGVPLPGKFNNTDEALLYIRMFFQLGIRMMHLTYNRRNMIGDGCGEPNDSGLSDFGRMVIKEMNKVGVIVDVAHSGFKTSLQAAQISDQPIVASHTGCYALNPHYRCKPDNVIKAIVDKDGIVGICAIPRFLGGSGDINAMLDHIDYAVKKFGVDHVSIATDLGYHSPNADIEEKKLPQNWKLRSRTRWEALWPPFDYIEKPYMRQSTAWTNRPLFTVGLVQRGYSDKDIQKIIGENVLRVAKAVFPKELKKV